MSKFKFLGSTLSHINGHPQQWEKTLCSVGTCMREWWKGVDSKGYDMMVNTIDIDSDHRRKLLLTTDITVTTPCFNNYMKWLSPPTSHMHSMTELIVKKELIG